MKIQNPKKPEPTIQDAAFKSKCCGKGDPVKQNSTIEVSVTANSNAIKFSATAPIRFPDISAVNEETVHTKEAKMAISLPKINMIKRSDIRNYKVLYLIITNNIAEG